MWTSFVPDCLRSTHYGFVVDRVVVAASSAVVGVDAPAFVAVVGNHQGHRVNCRQHNAYGVQRSLIFHHSADCTRHHWMRIPGVQLSTCTCDRLGSEMSLGGDHLHVTIWSDSH